MFFLAACSSQKVNEISKEENQVIVPERSPQDIQINRSLVLAELKEIKDVTENGFHMTAQVIEIEQNDAYPSIAVVNETYVLRPNFEVDEQKKLADGSERNQDLKTLTKLKPGDKFRAEIFLSGNGWFIQRILK